MDVIILIGLVVILIVLVVGIGGLVITSAMNAAIDINENTEEKQHGK